MLRYHWLAWLCRSINYRNMKSPSSFSLFPFLAALNLYLRLSSLLSALYFFIDLIAKMGEQRVLVPVTRGQQTSQVGQVPSAPQRRCGCSLRQRVPGGCSTHSSQGSLWKTDHGSWVRGRTIGTSSGEECLQRQLRTLMTVSAVFYGNKLSRPNPTANG